MRWMTERRSIGFRALSVFTCLMFGYSSVGAGLNSAAITFYGVARAAMQGRAPMHTDSPRAVYLGDDPKREPETRGGMWSQEMLAALQAQSVKNQDARLLY